MKFKLGDKVRLKREWLAEQAKVWDLKSYEILGWKIDRIKGSDICWPNDKYSWYDESCLELVPEESEFERWEMVEVRYWGSDERSKRIFIYEIHWADNPYVCIDGTSLEDFKEGKKFRVAYRDKIRKIKQELSRKEIAEKFWVNEDFKLVD